MNRITAVFFCALFAAPAFAQLRVLTLPEAITVATSQSYATKSALLNLESARKSFEASRNNLWGSLQMEFDLPRFSKNLKSQFNTVTGTEEFYEVGNNTMEGRLSLTQPILFTNGTFSLNGSLFARDQFNQGQPNKRDYYSNLSVRLRQPIFTFNNLSASLKRAELNLQKAQKNYDRASMDQIYNVSAAFYRLYQSKMELQIARDKVEQTRRSFETAQNKFKAGLIAEVEALQLEIDLASAKNDGLAAENRLQEALDNFKLLLGLPLEDSIDVTADIQFRPVVVDTLKAIQYALERRQEIQNAESDITLSELSKDETNSRGRVSGLIIANYGVNKNEDAFRDVFSNPAQDRSVTFTVSIPVWDWGKNSREVEAAEANLQLARLNLDNQKLQVQKEILGALSKLKAARLRAEVLSKSVELANKSYEISLSRFSTGTITSFDLTQMQIRLTNARLESLSALIDYRLAIADLSRKTLFDWEK